MKIPEYLKAPLPVTSNRPLPLYHALPHYQLPMRSTYKPAWQAILAECGYPTPVVVLDFETYFDRDYSLTKLSTVEYIQDPRFETLGLAVLEVSQSFPDYEQDTHFWAGEEGVALILGYLQTEYGPNLERCTVVIKNAAFDASILAHRFGVHPPYVVDIDCLARHWQTRINNGLADLALRYGLPAKGDTSQFSGCSLKQRRHPGNKGKPPTRVPPMSTEQAGALVGYACNDVLREWELFTILLPKLSRPSVELPVMQHTLELFTKPTLKVDLNRAESLKQSMLGLMADACSAAFLTQQEVSGNKTLEDALIAALENAGDTPALYLKPVKGGGWKIAEAKSDVERTTLLTHQDETVRLIMNARVAVKSWPLHISRIDRLVNQATVCKGLLPVPLRYHGAHTGRWSGTEKLNLQNLGAKSHELINAIREIIVAPPDHELVIVDSSQIEARVLAWIAGQADLVEKFRLNQEIYCDFATKVLGWPVRKPRKTGIPVIEARYKWARNSVGKIGVLGCGYGMGKDRMVEQYPGELDLDLADRIVKVYRKENASITQFWSDIERAFIAVVKYAKPCVLPRGLRLEQTDGCDVILTLPSGRELKYHRTRVTVGSHGMPALEVFNEQEKHWDYLWGGHLTENIVQAISRDILIEAVLDLEKAGHHTAHHVHDEIILVVPEKTGPGVLQTAIARLSQEPAWGAGLPLAAEGIVTTRYGGH